MNSRSAYSGHQGWARARILVLVLALLATAGVTGSLPAVASASPIASFTGPLGGSIGVSEFRSWAQVFVAGSSSIPGDLTFMMNSVDVDADLTVTIREWDSATTSPVGSAFATYSRPYTSPVGSMSEVTLSASAASGLTSGVTYALVFESSTTHDMYAPFPTFTSWNIRVSSNASYERLYRRDGGSWNQNANDAVLFSLASAVSTDSTLSNLVCSTCTLDTAFASVTTSYTSTVANNVSNVTITPTTTDSAATVTVNGTAVTSGTPSNPINLNVGTNTVTIVVTAEDTTTTTYSLAITRSASTDSTLSNLVCSTCTLDTAFASVTTSYTSTVANNVSNVTITPTTTDSAATVTVNGTAVTSGTPSNPINLNVGTNTVTIVVTAQDASTTTYTLSIRRRSAPVSESDSGASAESAQAPTPTAPPTSSTTHQQIIMPSGNGDASLPSANPVVAIEPTGYLRVTSAAAANAAPIRQMRKAGTRRLGPAPKVTSAPDTPIRLQVPDMDPEQIYNVLLRRSGTRYVHVGQVQPWQDGTLALPVISLLRKGSYVVAVADPTGTPRYVKIRVN